MGIRTNVDITVQAGFDNLLNDLAFDRSLVELLDTMEHVKTENGSLAAAVSNQAIDFGDVTLARLIYVEADNDIRVTFGGIAALAAVITGAGGTFNTGFVGGEIAVMTIDGTVVTTTFLAADQTAAQVALRMNAAAALAGLPTPVVAAIAGPELEVTSPTTGSLSTVVITASAPMTTLGLTGTATGVDPVASAPPIFLARMGDAAGSDIDGLKAFVLATVQTSAMFLDNPSATEAVNYRLMIVGDLTPAVDC